MSRKVTCIIIDDELKACENLRLMLSRFCQDVEILGMAHNVEEAISAICAHKPQLLFVDIHLGKEESFSIIENTSHISKVIIFITAHNTYASEAFRHEAVDYLLKPVGIGRLQHAVEKAKNVLSAMQQGNTANIEAAGGTHSIFIPEKRGWRAIPVREIVFVEADRSYAKVHLTTSESVIVSKNLKYIETLLSRHSGFMRIHKSFIANLQYVREVLKTDNGCIMLEDQRTLPVSKNIWDSLLLALSINSPGTE